MNNSAFVQLKINKRLNRRGTRHEKHDSYLVTCVVSLLLV